MKDPPIMATKENIVITGISGRFPKCDNVEKFEKALFDGADLIEINDKRYPAGVLGVPKRIGTVPEIDKFDTSFFRIHPKQAHFMDPRHRLLLETVYECIVDAGYNPVELRGTKTGVYVGISSMPINEAYRKVNSNGYVNIGLSLALAANRISYCFDFKGPSYSLDTACSSGMVAFANAIKDLEAGETDMAIVSAAHLIFHPQETKDFDNLNMLSAVGKCQVFCSNRDGYVRSETVVSYLLQRESKSRRIYATVMGSKTNSDGYKDEGITAPSSENQLLLMRELYEEKRINPEHVNYVEAHGTGTRIGDENECNAIVQMFCQNRKEKLAMGAVKSNMGHSEMASGLCSLAKAIITLDTGIIPATLISGSIDTEISGIKDNKLEVVTENIPFKNGLVAINSFGFGGANAHVVLKSNDKEKKVYNKPKHRLVNVSGRTTDSVIHFLNELQTKSDDEDLLALVDAIHRLPIDGHNYRGYAILGDTTQKEVSTYLKDAKERRPIFFIYTGMGCQWPGMAKDLMKFDVFRNTLQRCANALAPYGVDLIDIVTNTSPTTFNSINNCFVAIGCMEIAITDLLYSLDIVPDGIAGHSLGEVGCSYADGQITPEQAALLAYARGYASTNTAIPKGQMAAVGLSKEDLQPLLPEGVFIACQNSKTSMTISGLEDPVKTFVEELSSKGVFTRLVPSTGIAFHTKHIAEAGELLLKFCKTVLPDPKPRSAKWVSSSVPPSKAHLPWAKMNCAEYHHNNFCNTVLFDQVYQHIPKNAIVVEVAPHGLLQAILKRELGKESTSISLVNRTSEDNELFFLSAVGKIFNAGGQPNLRKLYQNVSFPVSRNTAKLAPMVQWDHGVTWFTPMWKNEDSFGREVVVNLSDEKYAALAGHFIDGRILMPAVGYLELVWETVADTQLKKKEELPIIFENVKFKRATVLSHGEDVKFLINIMKQSGNFEIFEGGSVVITGTTRCPKNVSKEYSIPEVASTPSTSSLAMKLKDVYKECHLRRYHYEGVFQGLSECDIFGYQGKLQWNDNFTSFMDTMLHLTILENTSRYTMLPVSMGQVIIDPVQHLQLVQTQSEVPVQYDQNMNVLRSGGIEISFAESLRAPQRHQTHDNPTLESFEFIEFDSTTPELGFDTALRTALQIILQNKTGLRKNVAICELMDDKKVAAVTDQIKPILNSQPIITVQYSAKASTAVTEIYDVIVVDDNSWKGLGGLVSNLSSEGFFLYTGKDSPQDPSLQIIFQASSSEGNVFLLRPHYDFPENYTVVNIRNSDFEWVEKLRKLANSEEPKVVYLFSQGDEISGIIGLMKCLLVEPSMVTYRSVLIDQNTDVFSVDDEFYRNQLRKNLTFNVLKNKRWGTYVHLPLEPVAEKEAENASITVLTPGDLSSLKWIERPPPEQIYEDSQLVYVHYSALNFKDVMIASGKLQSNDTSSPTAPELTIGLEYSGVTASGVRVMGMTSYEGLSLQVRSDPGFAWEIPRNWSLRDAATVPCVYTTCYYALMVRGQMLPGESILIHAGTGGIGLAAISIALSMGCKVFTTVGSQEKREFLKKLYPQLEDKNIGHSRSKSFEKMIMTNTKGKGVDLVLNSLSDDLFQASLRCIGRQGRFLEIGKVDFFNGTPIDSHMFLKNCSFHGVLLDDIFDSPSLVKRNIHRLLEEGIASGVVKPLPSTVFDETEVEAAFRFLSSGKHKGKVLVQLRKKDSERKKKIQAIPQVYVDPTKTYVVVGGLGGVGLELTDWLIKRGATNIILNSRRDVSTGHQAYYMRKWSQYKHISVKVNTDDTTSLEGATRLLKTANKLGPVGGVFNVAVVLKDALMMNQTKQNFEDVFAPKLRSGQNLDIASRKLCKQLEYFVVFSSVTAGRGNIGQSNYALANSALEKLCEIRKSDGLPAVAIQFGPVADVGAISKMANSGKEVMETHLLVPQSPNSCFQVMEKMMLMKQAISSSLVVAHSETASTNATRSPAEAVAHILGVNDIELIDKSSSLLQIGLDSLMVAEIKQTLYRHYQLDYNLDEIRDLTFDKLIALSEHQTTTKEEEPEIHKTALDYMLPKELVVKLNASNGFKRNIFMIHPIEGNVNILKPMAEHLKATVYGFQATEASDFDDLVDIARFYLEKIRSIQSKGPYCLCGYSYGSLVSLEIGLQLEKAGETADMVFLDGSPEYVRRTLGPAFERLGGSEEKSKLAVLKNYFRFLPSAKQNEVEKILDGSKGWTDRLQEVGELLAGEIGQEASHIAKSANQYYRRSYAVFFYEPKTTFGGKVLLLRREENSLLTSDNYDWQKVCQQTVKVVKIKGDHQTILLGQNSKIVANSINDTFLSD